MALKVLESNEDFVREMKADSLLIWFTATWCIPCRQITPALDEVAQKRDVLKIDIDKFPELATQYTVMSIPTLIDFKHGEQTVKSIGVKPKAAILRDFAV